MMSHDACRSTCPPPCAAHRALLHPDLLHPDLDNLDDGATEEEGLDDGAKRRRADAYLPSLSR
jgi:hypothetical protein